MTTQLVRTVKWECLTNIASRVQGDTWFRLTIRKGQGGDRKRG